ncbi:AraC family transcriptional regulator [Candidatus Soleaferrea massiliensis]|uniref:AraC family transcriptional regulator n=1 Tax=Candidatus Soleaferrea massiliensis TaxID=1470354 RepID=UPI00058CB22E|nr:AraC family transcriptional regulator [Candidatus Soleaferrea massiliensis]
MTPEQRIIRYDAELGIEAYYFEGVMQRFPNHFHEHYVVGAIVSGARRLTCCSREYIIRPGDLVLFNPLDSHACEQVGDCPLELRFLNIPPKVMERAAEEITGYAYQPRFAHNTVPDSELCGIIAELHRMIMDGDQSLGREELFCLLMEQLFDLYALPPEKPVRTQEDDGMQRVCEYLQEHYAEHIGLEELGRIANCSKYHLVRSFTKEKGISPYSYLMTIRIGEAKKLLETGQTPAQAALLAGFSDQSHFTRCFKRLTGLTPRQYHNIFYQGENRHAT